MSEPRPRRSQQTRRAEMRTRLLDATLECLATQGYAASSTTVICKRAGVSRGAQVHHFPTKADLMVAAVERVFELRRQAFRAGMSDGPGPASVTEALERMWQVVQGGPTVAWLELVVAGRTDPALHAAVLAATERLRAAAVDELARLPDLQVDPDALLLASALMDGLVVQELAGLGPDRRDRVLALFETLATQLPGGLS